MHRRVGEIYRLLDLRMIYVTTLDGYMDHIPQLTNVGDDGYVHGILTASTPTSDADTTGRDLKRRVNTINTELGHYERDIGILLEKFRNLIDLVSPSPMPTVCVRLIRSRSSTFKAR